MRVKLDENLPVQRKALFTESGHDAATVVDEGLGGAPDAAIASACITEERRGVSHDHPRGWSDPERHAGAGPTSPRRQAEAAVSSWPPDRRHAASARSAMARVRPSKMRTWIGHSAYQ